MECLPPAQAGRTFYEPTERGLEAEIRKKLEDLRKNRRGSRPGPSSDSGNDST
jgi:hypothetical protein